MSNVAVMQETAMQKLQRKWKEGKYLCVGLDPVLEDIPEDLKSHLEWPAEKQMGEYGYLKYVGIRNALAEAVIFDFLKKVVDSTHEFAAAYKPNEQFYKRFGHCGMRALERICQYITENYPDILLILDAKYSDLGNTNKAAAEFAFGLCCADSVTLNPLPGKEQGLDAFFEYPDKLFFVLGEMSHKGAKEFGGLEIQPTSISLASHIAKTVERWNGNGNMGLVVGATCSDQRIRAMRHFAPSCVFLMPGLGRQGGDMMTTVRAGLDSNGEGILINVSSYITSPKHKAEGEDHFEAVARAAKNFHEDIKKEVELAPQPAA
ncbi:MAG: orotidine-5'-phosphate decarboxylase [Patescibacteria group bacterium]